MANLIISPGGHSLADDANWLNDHSHDDAESAALLTLDTYPVQIGLALLNETPSMLISASDNALAAIRGDSRLARLVSSPSETDSYATMDKSSAQEKRHYSPRVNDDDVLPSAMRRLVGGGDRVSFRF